jgi:succinate dehydrogenase / fumarate reductase, iron-sulfur subunit
MDLTLHVWRQAGPDEPGRMVTYADEAKDISPDMSFLEMLDIVNERLIAKGEEPIAFEHDCREGICGSCGMMINGQAHGPQRGTATCQLHMRKFSDGDEIFIEPWRARAFPVLRDLIVDRQAFDRIIEAGGYITAPTGAAPDANLILVPKDAADAAMDAAACIACGACVAACPNSTCCRRVRPSATPAPRRWSTPWSSTSAPAPTMPSARRRARRRYPSTSSPT